MKKILLLSGLVMLSTLIWAKDVPNVIVHKSNGGYWAWLNLYNDITYTPSTMEGMPASLECYGSGFSACRVPNVNGLTASSTSYDNRRRTTSTAEQQALAAAINELLEISEDAGTRGNLTGTASKKISIPTGTRGSNTLYLVKGTWSFNSQGEGTVYIYISESNLLLPR